MALKFEYFYTSHIGKCRRVNQDNFFSNGHLMPAENTGTNGIIEAIAFPEDEPVFAIFDGMGGEECGEVAAYIAAEEMQNYSFEEGMEKGFFDFCASANRKICQYTQDNGISSMGTTAAIMRFAKKDSCLCNIGDSKVFLLDKKQLVQISYDHVGIAAFGRKPPLSQNLGIPEDEMIIEPYVARGSYRDGDVYLICSDGVTDMLPLEEIQRILVEHPGREAAQMLLDGALENGGRDNTTLILIYVKKQKRKLFGRRER